MRPKEDDPEYMRLLEQVMLTGAHRNTVKWRQQRLQLEAHKFAARRAAVRRWKSRQEASYKAD